MVASPPTVSAAEFHFRWLLVDFCVANLAATAPVDGPCKLAWQVWQFRFLSLLLSVILTLHIPVSRPYVHSNSMCRVVPLKRLSAKKHGKYSQFQSSGH